MSFIVNGRDMGDALDRYITGNYGEDQFKSCDKPECPFFDKETGECNKHYGECYMEM
jgi:hypothetical protein